MANWTVYEYEVGMFRSTLALCKSDTLRWFFSLPVNNAVIESMLLHTRIIVDIVVPRDSRDLNLDTLLPGFVPPSRAALEKAYGDDKPPTPHWTLNKMLAHPTFDRKESYDYMPTMKTLEPLIEACLKEIEDERVKTAPAAPVLPSAGLFVGFTMTTSSF
jgi:hypothetical protein